VFVKTNIEFGYYDVNEYYLTVHLEWNLLLVVGVGEENDIVAYNMDNRKVHVIPTRYSQFLKHGILPEINGRPYYLPYVPLFSELVSLAKE
jgi:hypothetical protein